MPEICRFHGIVIRMFANDHAPPHFHAEYAGQDASFSIADGTTRATSFPRRARNLVARWAVLHHDELMENWERLRRHEGTRSITPLP